MLTHEKRTPDKRDHQMIFFRRNSLMSPVERWILGILVIIVCAGCQPQPSQLEPDLSEPVAAIKPMIDHKTVEKTDEQVSASGIDSTSIALPTTASQTSDQTSQPKAAQSTPTLPAIGSDKEALIEDIAQTPKLRTKPSLELSPQVEQPKQAIKKPVVLQRNGKTYQPYHLNKNQTLLLLAAQPDIRSRILASTVREVTTPQQQLAAEQLAATFDQQYVEILRQRAVILETAVDGGDTEAKLLELRMTTADLNAKIRRKINQEILTQDQRSELQRNFEQSQSRKPK